MYNLKCVAYKFHFKMALKVIFCSFVSSIVEYSSVMGPVNSLQCLLVRTKSMLFPIFYRSCTRY